MLDTLFTIVMLCKMSETDLYTVEYKGDIYSYSYTATETETYNEYSYIIDKSGNIVYIKDIV